MKRIAVVLILSLALAAGLAAQAPAYNLKSPIAAKPAFLTSVGQSADLEMVKVPPGPLEDSLQGRRAGKRPLPWPPAGAKSLVLAIGGSSKGLGAAGISAEVEIERAQAVIAEAKKQGMKIIGVHVGGGSSPRRALR